MRSRAVLLALGVLAIVVAYANSLHNSFHFDDSHVIENNLYIRSLSNIPRFFVDADTFSSLPANATYRPLVTLTLALDYHLGGGLDPRQFHITQIALLVLLMFLLVRFFSLVMRRGENGHEYGSGVAAIAAAVLFSVHTGNTETMNLISARSELLAAIGVVGAFLIYQEIPSFRRYGLFLLPLAAGALAKAPVIIFAPMLLAYILLFEEANWRKALLRTAPVFAFCALLGGLLSRMNDPHWTSGGGDRLDYIRTQAWIWLHYFRMFFVPAGLTADTDLAPIPWWDTRFFAGIAFLVALGIAITVMTRAVRLRPAAFGLWWFVLALIPTSSVFPLAELSNDHRLFFPFIGLALAVVWCAALALQGRERIATGLALFFIVANVIGTHVRNRDWLTEETLWRDVTIKSPMNGRGLMNYGLTQMAKGKLVEARDLFQRALPFTPNYATLEINLGIVNGALGDQVEAQRHFARSLVLSDAAEEHFFYARWLLQQGRGPEALVHLNRALQIVSSSPMSRSLLMLALSAKGDEQTLQRVARETLAIAPADPEAIAYLQGRLPVPAESETYGSYVRLGQRMMSNERIPEAAQAFRYALKMQPGGAEADAGLRQALQRLGFQAITPRL